MKIKTLCALLFGLILLNACDKKVAKPTLSVVTVNKCDTITFAKHIKGIVQKRCVVCHNGTQTNVTNANFNLYSDLKEKALNGKLKSYAVDGNPIIMPKFGTKLPQDTLDLIICWINNGAKE
ncbi:MAG: hypothetical protein WCR21_02750 [Bacteroidota bacterium]